MKPVALLIHANPLVAPDYAKALGLERVVCINEGSYSAAYDEFKGLASRFRTLDALIRRYAPGTPEGAPVVLIGFSAGCWSVRYYLRDPEARKRCVAVMLIDGLHAGKGSEPGLGGPAEYAREAIAGRAVFVLTHSQIVPPYTSTRDTADNLLERLGLSRKDKSASVHVQSFHLLAGEGADGAAHSRQLTKIGPDAVRLYIAPILDSLAEPASETWDDATEVMSVGALAVGWCRTQMSREQPPSTTTKSSWFAKCERAGKAGFLGTKHVGNHCAAAQCAAAFACSKDADVLPHRFRAGAKELMADAIQSGAWVAVEHVHAGWRPSMGDLAIYDRSQPGRPETAWWGHVDRVCDVGVNDYENIGANEGPGGAWRVQRTPYSHPTLLGFVRYPQRQAPEPNASAVQPAITDAERRHAETLITITMAASEAEWWDELSEQRRKDVADK